MAVFPHVEHGIYQFETKPDGTRVDTRNPDGYFTMMRDYILNGSLHDDYGSAIIFRPGHTSTVRNHSPAPRNK